MKKFLIITSLLLILTITVPSNIDASIEQSSGSVVPGEVYQAIDDLDYEKLVSILTVTGPLSKEAKGLPILTLYKLRDKVIIDGSNLREKLLIDARVLDVGTEALFWSAVLSFVVGIGGGVGALGVREWTFLNRVLSSGVSLGSTALCSYIMGVLAKRERQKVADRNALIEPFNQKLDILKNMIDLLESHSELI